jgi:predicted MFS family arabinose efflux permease
MRVAVTRYARFVLLGALVLSVFSFNTVENLPIGVLTLISASMRVSLEAVGYVVTGYAAVVTLTSLPLAYGTRHIPRRFLLVGVLALLVCGSWLTAAASSYTILFAARIATALAQALFWAIVGPVAVGLFPAAVRGRVIGTLSVGGSLATVLGVPAGTWLGQQHGWHVPFVVVGALGLACLLPVGLLLPTARPAEEPGAYGTAPDPPMFAVVLVTTMLAVTGAFTGFTYITAFLRGVTKFSGDDISLMLMVFGLAALCGVSVAGPLLDKVPWATLMVPVTIQAVALFGMGAAGGIPAVAVAALALFGLAAAPIFMATQAWMLRVAPGRTEIGLAANSAAFNAGIALGALLGGLIVDTLGSRSAFSAGGLLTATALGTLVAERLIRRGQHNEMTEQGPADVGNSEKAAK